MNKYAKISILVGVVVVFIVLLYVFGGKSKPKEDYVSDNWYETYSPEDKGPYGTFVMRQLLDTVNMFGNFVDVNKPLEEDLLDNEDLNDIYFFIGKTNFMEDSTAEFLMDFVANGNTALCRQVLSRIEFVKSCFTILMICMNITTIWIVWLISDFFTLI